MDSRLIRKERVALALAVMAGLAITFYLQWIGGQAQAKIDAALAAIDSKKLVVVAGRKIGAGQPVKELDVHREWVFSRDVEPGAVRSLDKALGRVATQDIYIGEQVLLSHLGSGSGRASQSLAEGKSAIAIPLDDIAAVPPAVVPGDRVDVFGFDDSGIYGRTLKYLLVRGIGGRPPFSDQPLRRSRTQDNAIAPQGESKWGQRSLILEVEQWQAAAISSMAEAGRVRVALRSSGSGEGR